MTHREPVRCFEGSAKPFEPFWRIQNAAETTAAELEFYGFISEYSWMEDDITPAKFRQDLAALKGKDLTLKINSPGGDVIAASVIRSIISEYPGKVTTRIEGIAASAAVIVAMAGSDVKIMDSAYMMIHDPYVVFMMAALNIEDLGKLKDELKSIKEGIASTYATKTGLSVEKVSKMMADETWMSANEAVKFGFADEVIKGGNGEKKNVAYVNALRNFVNVPPELLNSAEQQVDVKKREADRLRAKVNLYK